MASAMASVAAHNVPPAYAIPLGSRVRPPRLLPGTKAANTNPQPEEPPPSIDQVWVQGKWRHVNSNAARDRRHVQSRQVEKALKHVTHGMNIYAYSNIRTNQVVYSLTRVMQNNKILPQLMFHGKKTVPAALRRDMWRPYFSIHFPETSAGAETGLKAYHRLRELAAWRQLSPDRDSLIATEADVEKAKQKYTPMELRSGLESHRLKGLPVKNQLLPKRFRAKRLMDQKASSVADAASVLESINKDLSPAQKEDVMLKGRAERYEQLSYRATRRLDKIRDKEMVKQGQIEGRKELIRPYQGGVGLERHAVERIAIEHDGAVTEDQMVTDLAAMKSGRDVTASKYMRISSPKNSKSSGFDEQAFRAAFVTTWKEQNPAAEGGPPAEEINAAVAQEQEARETKVVSSHETKNRNKKSKIVQVLWADMRDATWAEKWSSNVYHGELDARAVVKKKQSVIRQQGLVDEDGNEISEQRHTVLVVDSSTPHVFGKGVGEQWYQSPKELTEKNAKGRSVRVEEWKATKLEQSKELFAVIDNLCSEHERLRVNKVALEPEFTALQQATVLSIPTAVLTDVDRVVNNLTDAEKDELQNSMATVEAQLLINQEKLDEFEKDYPTIYHKAMEVRKWRDDREKYAQLLKIKDELNSIDPFHDATDNLVRSQLERIDASLATYAERHSELSDIATAESGLAARTLERKQTMVALAQKSSEVESTPDTESKANLLEDIQDDLQSQKDMIRTDQQQTWDTRWNAVDQILQDEAELYGDSTDLLVQRSHAEKQGDLESIETINADLKAQEDIKVQEIFGFEVQSAHGSSDLEVKINEMDGRSLRERGIEMPPPRQPSRGIWGRVKGLFGR